LIGDPPNILIGSATDLSFATSSSISLQSFHRLVVFFRCGVSCFRREMLPLPEYQRRSWQLDESEVLAIAVCSTPSLGILGLVVLGSCCMAPGAGACYGSPGRAAA
jgi:Na+/H+ antiporter NhaD/arsenite permease-like protein